MVYKPHLQHFALEFNWGDEGEQRQILDVLEPHSGLKSLFIYKYGGGAFSHWLSSLHSLKVLTLRWCSKCKILPPLGKLAFLESLQINGFDQVSKVGVEFWGIEQGQSSSSSSVSISFPKLKELTISWMKSWEEWEGVEKQNSQNITCMPDLDRLEINHCQRLTALPDFLWKTRLQKLYIYGSPVLKELYKERTAERRSKISQISTVVIEDDDPNACCIC